MLRNRRDLNSSLLDCPDATYGSSHRKPGNYHIAHLSHHICPAKIGPSKLAIEKSRDAAQRRAESEYGRSDGGRPAPRLNRRNGRARLYQEHWPGRGQGSLDSPGR